MPKTIDIPEVGEVEFPDELTDQQIAQIARNLHLKAVNAKPLSEPTTSGEGFKRSMWRDVGQFVGGMNPLGVLKGLRERIPEQAAMFGARTMEAPSLGEVAGNVKELGRAIATEPETQGALLGMIAAPSVVPRIARPLGNRAVSGGLRMQQRAARIPRGSAVPASTTWLEVARQAARPVVRTTGQILEQGGRALGGSVPFDVVERYRPSVSGYTPGSAIPRSSSAERVPYGGAVPRGPASGPNAPVPGGKAPGLESVLDEILQSEMAAAPPSRITLPPQPGQTMTPTGRPSLSPAGYDELVGAGARNPALVPVGEESLYNAPRQTSPLRSPDELAYELIRERMAGPPAATSQAVAPSLEEMRRVMGAEATAGQLEPHPYLGQLTAEQVRDLTGGAPSRRPYVAEEADLAQRYRQLLEQETPSTDLDVLSRFAQTPSSLRAP